MLDDDFDINSLSDGLDGGDKNSLPKKKRRVVGSDEEGVEFKFDFDIGETADGENEAEKSGEDLNIGSYEAMENLSNDNKVKNLLEAEKASVVATKKGKRVFELDDMDFDKDQDELLLSSSKAEGTSKARGKRKGIFGNEFGVLEEDLERIYEIQRQIKASKKEIEVSKGEKEKLFTKEKIIILVRVGILTILFLIMFFSIEVIKNNKELSNKKHVYIKQDDTVSNESNFIYVDTPLQFEDGIVKIKKIRLDSQELAIYFDRPIDTDKYTIHVLDSDLNKYYNTTDFNHSYENGEDAKYTFEPLATGTEKFSVRIENIETGYLIETVFTLEEPVKYPPAKFFYNSAPENEDMYVQNMVISSAYTKSTVLANGDLSDMESINESSIESGNMYLKYRGTTVPINTAESDFVYFDEYSKGLSIIENSPLSSLSSTLTFGEENIYKRMQVNEYIDINSLNRGFQINRTTDNANVTLEGIYDYDGVVVIPMTGTKINAIPPNPKVEYNINSSGEYESEIIENEDENYDKIAVQMYATLYCTDDEGNQFTVPAECKIGEEGTDVIFRDERLQGKNLSDMKIFVFNYATIEDGEQRVINLSNMRDNQRAVDIEFERLVKENFLTRLKYKSKEVPKSYIKGFDDNIISNFVLDEIYKPIDTSTSVYYSVNIEGYAYEDNKYYAIVDETWTAKDISDNVVSMKNRHKIVAEKQGRNYNIVYDKIIEE